jgi:hypothetical protein
MAGQERGVLGGAIKTFCHTSSNPKIFRLQNLKNQVQKEDGKVKEVG